jgi:hypothetical protein
MARLACIVAAAAAALAAAEPKVTNKVELQRLKTGNRAVDLGEALRRIGREPGKELPDQ